MILITIELGFVLFGLPIVAIFCRMVGPPTNKARFLALSLSLEIIIILIRLVAKILNFTLLTIKINILEVFIPRSKINYFDCVGC